MKWTASPWARQALTDDDRGEIAATLPERGHVSFLSLTKPDSRYPTFSASVTTPHYENRVATGQTPMQAFHRAMALPLVMLAEEVAS